MIILVPSGLTLILEITYMAVALILAKHPEEDIAEYKAKKNK